MKARCLNRWLAFVCGYAFVLAILPGWVAPDKDEDGTPPKFVSTSRYYVMLGATILFKSAGVILAGLIVVGLLLWMSGISIPPSRIVMILLVIIIFQLGSQVRK